VWTDAGPLILSHPLPGRCAERKFSAQMARLGAPVEEIPQLMRCFGGATGTVGLSRTRSRAGSAETRRRHDPRQLEDVATALRPPESCEGQRARELAQRTQSVRPEGFVRRILNHDPAPSSSNLISANA